MQRRKVLGVAAALSAVAALTWAARPRRQVAAEPGFRLEDLFPTHFGEWRIDPSGDVFVRAGDGLSKVEKVYDQVLERVYVNAQDQRMMLVVAYGGDQSPAFQMHRPEVCYEYGGFQVHAPQRTELSLAGRRVPATQVFAQKPTRPEPVLYWIVLGGEAVAGMGEFRVRQIRFGLQRRALDGMQVRISSIDPDPRYAWAQQARFAEQMALSLSADARDRVLGRVSAPS